MERPAEIFERSASATIANGKGLLEDAKLLFEMDRFSTALALAVLAQEEFAKAFVLHLVADDALLWVGEVRRSVSRHQCKHLIAILMEWLPFLDTPGLLEQIRQQSASHEARMAWFGRSIERSRRGLAPDPNDPEPIQRAIVFPHDVAAALNIYRHEEVERLSGCDPLKDPSWSTGPARTAADGALDRKKQSALYVSITRAGRVGTHPGHISRGEATEAITRAERLAEMPVRFSDEYFALKTVVAAIFADLAATPQEAPATVPGRE